ncbi:hypothetical protein [Streptomyces sp. NPDC088707]|uniref:hypothetical protein n=1 Tax=Streptomyces sp. NPDC088707 TaxID=3365871 RepID=UPI00380B6F64
MSTIYPPEFTKSCDACGTSVDGPDVACDTTWDVPAGAVEPPLTRTAVWCVNCHETERCECGPDQPLTPASTEERLVRFVSDRVGELVMHGAAEQLAAGTMALLVSYSEILPHLKDKGPDYATGVADGLGQAVRYIAGTWHQHPDYEQAFAVQAPATTDEWVRS